MKQAGVPSILIAVLLLALGVIADAQQPTKVPRIGYLGGPNPLLERREAFRQGLRELGYNEGKNIIIEWRSGEGKSERVPALAAELSPSQGRCNCHRWFEFNPRSQGSNVYDSHCHGPRRRSGWEGRGVKSFVAS